MNNNRASQHALRSDQLDHLVFDATLCVPLSIRLEITEIANVTLGVGGATVSFGEGVDWEKDTISDYRDRREGKAFGIVLGSIQ